MAVCYQIKSLRTIDTGHLDAEFYQPKYRYLDRLIQKKKSDVGSLFETNVGFTFSSKIFSDKGDYPVVKMTQIPGDGFIDLQNAEYIQQAFFENVFENFIVRKDDIIVALTGATVGKSGLYVDEIKSLLNQRVFSARDKTKNISTKFLLPLFLSKVFRDWVYRNSLGGGQGNVAPDSIKGFPILNFPDSFIRKVEILVAATAKSYFQSKKLYPEAEQELLERMEWYKVATNHKLGYVATSKDILTNERLDPEFYQPKFENLEKHLKKIGAVTLGNFCREIKRGASPVYCVGGEVAIVNSQNLSDNGVISIEDLEKTDTTFYQDEKNGKACLKQFDILVYATGAYIGRTNCWLENIKAVAGIDCIIIETNRKICNPVYLALFLNSQSGLLQANRRASGSAQRHLYPNDLAKYQVFIPRDKNGKPDLVWQKKLADKVISANQAKKDAKQKLDEAKQLVEKEVEYLINAKI